MIMPRRNDPLLLPVSPIFVWTSLTVALLLNIVPLGRVPAMPDLLALVLVFWNVHQSRRVGVGLAFLFGLMMDVHSGAVLGQHAPRVRPQALHEDRVAPGPGHDLTPQQLLGHSRKLAHSTVPPKRSATETTNLDGWDLVAYRPGPTRSATSTDNRPFIRLPDRKRWAGWAVAPAAGHALSRTS